MSPQGMHAVRAEALFVSDVQRSDGATPQMVREAVASTVDLHGPVGCAALVAQEFGEHPDVAVDRMAWALDVVDDAYPPE